jgi:hypothetical protein
MGLAMPPILYCILVIITIISIAGRIKRQHVNNTNTKIALGQLIWSVILNANQ